ncbi:MAG: KH domain-containing protein [Candidatus Saccharimonadales bacterium]
MSNSIDQQFVEFVVKSLVSKPDNVSVARRIDEKGVLLELTVDPEDLGRVIGKRGATAQSIRTLLRALGTKNDARYNLKIVDNGPDREERNSSSSDEAPKQEGSWGRDDKETDTDTKDKASEESKKEPEVEDKGEEDKDKEDNFSRTRKELADLDDLDV